MPIDTVHARLSVCSAFKLFKLHKIGQWRPSVIFQVSSDLRLQQNKIFVFFEVSVVDSDDVATPFVQLRGIVVLKKKTIVLASFN